MRFYKICKCFILKKCIFYVIQKSLFIYYRCDVPRRFERIDGAFMFKILMKGKNMKIEKKNLNEALKVLGKVVSQTSPVDVQKSIRFVGDANGITAMATDGIGGYFAYC